MTPFTILKALALSATILMIAACPRTAARADETQTLAPPDDAAARAAAFAARNSAAGVDALGRAC